MLDELNSISQTLPLDACVAQAKDDLAELMCDAVRGKREHYDPFFEALARDAGVCFDSVGLKGLWRCMEKAVRTSCERLLDIVRGMLRSPDVLGLVRALDILRQSHLFTIFLESS